MEPAYFILRCVMNDKAARTPLLAICKLIDGVAHVFQKFMLSQTFVMLCMLHRCLPTPLAIHTVSQL